MAKLLALRRASSLLSRLAADSATGFAFIIEVVLPKYLWLLPKRHQRADRYLFTSSSRLVGAIWYRVWQVLFGPRRPADPRVSEIRSPPKSDFHTVVKKKRPEHHIVGVQHSRRNTEEYNSDEVEAMVRQVASEHPSIHFCHYL